MSIRLTLVLPRPPDDALAKFAFRIRFRVPLAAAAGGLAVPPAPAFVLITPIGLPHAAAILEALARRGVGPSHRMRLASWARIATLLYAKEVSDGALLRAWALEYLWARRWPRGWAEVLWLRAGADEVARRVKPTLRAVLPRVEVQVRLPGATLDARLHPFHVPDAVDGPREAALVARLAGANRRLAP
jgi:hypothetical protein